MDVGLNSGQLALRDSVRDVLRAECSPAIARQAMTDPNRWRTVWKTVVDLGWSELAVPTAAGDSAFGRMDLTVILEECGAALAPVPLLSSVGLAAGLAASGRSRRRRCAGRDRQLIGGRAGRSPTGPSAARGPDDAAGRAGARAGSRGAVDWPFTHGWVPR